MSASPTRSTRRSGNYSASWVTMSARTRSRRSSTSVCVNARHNESPEKLRPRMKSIKFVSTLLLLFISCACSTLAGKEEVGAVIARRAQVRSSTAVVVAVLEEVVRGDELDITDSVTMPDTGERWFHVRTRDAEPVEGWIEARNVISHEMIERSRRP